MSEEMRIGRDPMAWELIPLSAKDLEHLAKHDALIERFLAQPPEQRKAILQAHARKMLEEYPDDLVYRNIAEGKM